jgi:hypothetical protein
LSGAMHTDAPEVTWRSTWRETFSVDLL